MDDKLNFYYKIAASSYGKQKAAEIERETRELESGAPFDSPSWGKIQSALKKQRQKEQNHFYKYARMASVIVLALSVIGTTAVIHIDALRIKVFNFLFETREQYTQIVPSTENANDSFHLSGYFSPTLFPEGYHFSEIVGAGKNLDIYFSDDDSNSDIIFKQREPGKMMTYDTENMKIHEIKINGYDGFWGSKHEYTMVVWSNGSLIFSLLVPKEYDSFMEIAESVEFCQ